MKNFFLLLVLVSAGVGFYQLYLKDHPPAWLHLPGGEAATKTDAADTAPVAKKDFKEVSAVLQGDMDHIPMNLREARQMPSHAFDIKSRVAPYIQAHEEYKTLTVVCDTIISADQDFGQRQGKCGLGPPEPGASARPSAAAYSQQETLWESHRRQADADVRTKLATLANHRL